MNIAAVSHSHGVDAGFEQDVLAGLAGVRKSISCRWFYDNRGSELFEKITELPEYYLTRTEITLLRTYAARIARCIGPQATAIEFGSGSSRKTPLLLRAMQNMRKYVPVDIAAEFLSASTQTLRATFPDLPMQPVAADLMDPESLNTVARALPATGARLGIFLGSSIGNFTYVEAQALLRRFGDLLGAGAWLVIGVDSTRDAKLLLPAYDDSQGVTAAFNMNVLRRINRELNANFDLGQFEHAAWFYPARDRIEMHLVSRMRQFADVAGRRFEFAGGESIHTENCHKYTAEQFEAMALAAGWRREHRWSERERGYGLYLMRQM